MSETRLRVDKWVWFARFAKSRTTAQKLVADGRVRVNREKVLSAAHGLGPGDVLTMTLGSRIRVIKVLALADRRGPAAEAQKLYEDLTPLDPPRGTDGEPEAGSRPDKRQRRALSELRGKR